MINLTELVDFIRDQVCCPRRTGGCELNDSDECPAQRVRAVVKAAQAEGAEAKAECERWLDEANHQNARAEALTAQLAEAHKRIETLEIERRNNESFIVDLVQDLREAERHDEP